MTNNKWAQLGDNINGESKKDRSGVSISISADGMALAIGATHNDDNGDNAGHVRVFSLVNDVWTQLGSDIDTKSGSKHCQTMIENQSLYAI